MYTLKYINKCVFFHCELDMFMYINKSVAFHCELDCNMTSNKESEGVVVKS